MVSNALEHRAVVLFNSMKYPGQIPHSFLKTFVSSKRLVSQLDLCLPAEVLSQKSQY